MTLILDGTNVVYWIRHPHHTDMFTQGYVGVTKRFDRRLYEHNTFGQNPYLKNVIAKYGWDNLVKEKLVIATEEYCLGIEEKLRPHECIGWNLVKGGGKPPSSLGRRYKRLTPSWNKGIPVPPETKEKIKNKVKQLWANSKYRDHMSKAHVGKKSGIKGKKHSLESIEKMRQRKLGKKASEETKRKMSLLMRGRKMAVLTCVHCSKVGGVGAMRRWHMDNCKSKGETK